MKVLLINGSPHQFGCTYTALREVAGSLNKNDVIIFIGSLVMGEDVSGSFFLTVAMFPFGMIMASVLLPIIFKFGVEKGRFAFLAFIAFVVAAVVAGGRKLATLTEDGNIVGSLLSMNRGMMIGAVVLVTAAVAVISIVLSKNIYDKKEF